MQSFLPPSYQQHLQRDELYIKYGPALKLGFRELYRFVVAGSRLEVAAWSQEQELSGSQKTFLSIIRYPAAL
jgi:hypothetical protein